jgi:hypothetical protein
MEFLKAIFPLAVLISISVDAFYVPGIAPREFTRGSKIGKVFDDLAYPDFFTIVFFSYYFRGKSCKNDKLAYSASVRILFSSILSAQERYPSLQFRESR